MKKSIQSLLIVLVSLVCGISAKAVGWPANYEGVMLQGFSWDSYSDTRWQVLENQSDELSQYFKLIWIPNSGYAGGNRNMGYMPIYWFTNHNSSFGSEPQLRRMINTFKSKGTGIIADVVVNHRNGKSNWTDFPEEVWNGQTWKLGPEHICSNDELQYESGQAKPTGAPDTGENFNGARDLDHTNATVQNNVKNYCKFLLEDLGYAGFRLDMVKGYGGQYTKIYNQYSRPTYCVGEYFDSNYDLVKNWIEATGRESAAFDFPCKYAINEAFASNDMRKLVWNANGTTPQPAGMIHYAYQQYAVTFVDNHDTYRDGSKFTGNVLAANAFILCSPGTPCVFLEHWKEHKQALKTLIDIRNSVGVSNTSTVTVTKSTQNCYLATVKGSKGTLAVRIGSSSDVPQGFTSADVKASGNGYCVWTKTTIGGGDVITDDPITIYYDNSVTNWTKVLVHYWGASESTWPGVNMENVEGKIWKYTLPAKTDGVVFNNGSGAQTDDVYGLVNNHVYRALGTGDKPACEDLGEYGNTHVELPSSLYIIGNLKSGSWKTDSGVKMTKDGNTFVAPSVEFAAAAGETYCFFNMTTALAATWDELNSTADRFGATCEGEELSMNSTAAMLKYACNVSASGCLSWKVVPGTYRVVADFEKMTVALTNSSGVEEISIATPEPEYYNLQGLRVENPSSGLYIVKRGKTVTKEYIR